ncbi:MAG: carbohydrate binding domain-containing protein [Proteobacteria bacterium]|nr:carbohydrate binding domain-containing protein [Pseudomonadota bacterium]
MLKKLFLLTAAVVLLVAVQVGVGAAELVVNGGFETGDFYGWNEYAVYLNPPGGSLPVYSGTYAAYFASVGYDGYLSQSISTVAGQTYTISYYLKNWGGSYNEFSLAINSGTLAGSVLVNADTFDWTNYQFNFTATSSATNLTFYGRQDPTAYFLDNVSVTNAPVPIPSALLLFAPGLAGLAAIRRRFTK